MVRSAPATRGGHRNAGTVSPAARVAAPRRRAAWLKRRAPASTRRGSHAGVTATAGAGWPRAGVRRDVGLAVPRLAGHLLPRPAGAEPVARAVRGRLRR